MSLGANHSGEMMTTSVDCTTRAHKHPNAQYQAHATNRTLAVIFLDFRCSPDDSQRGSEETILLYLTLDV